MPDCRDPSSGLLDLLVIRLKATIQSCQQIVADAAEIEFVQMPAASGGNECNEAVAGEANLLTGIEIKIVRVDPHPLAAAWMIGRTELSGDLFEDVVRRDEVLINRVPQVWQI